MPVCDWRPAEAGRGIWNVVLFRSGARRSNKHRSVTEAGSGGVTLDLLRPRRRYCCCPLPGSHLSRGSPQVHSPSWAMSCTGGGAVLSSRLRILFPVAQAAVTPPPSSNLAVIVLLHRLLPRGVKWSLLGATKAWTLRHLVGEGKEEWLVAAMTFLPQTVRASP